VRKYRLLCIYILILLAATPVHGTAIWDEEVVYTYNPDNLYYEEESTFVHAAEPFDGGQAKKGTGYFFVL